MNLAHFIYSTLTLFVAFVGITILSGVVGVLGLYLHYYIGIALFLIFFAIGITGSIKMYFQA